MPIVRSPHTKRMLVVQRYDTDYVESNEQAKIKKSHNLKKAGVLTENNWNFNEWNTREDIFSDIYLPKLNKIPSNKNKYAGGLRSHNW
jgi:hypothetical protein